MEYRTDTGSPAGSEPSGVTDCIHLCVPTPARHTRGRSTYVQQVQATLIAVCFQPLPVPRTT
eukprot:6209378-Pleurochrysis_carterae.AAC.1